MCSGLCGRKSAALTIRGTSQVVSAWGSVAAFHAFRSWTTRSLHTLSSLIVPIGSDPRAAAENQPSPLLGSSPFWLTGLSQTHLHFKGENKAKHKGMITYTPQVTNDTHLCMFSRTCSYFGCIYSVLSSDFCHLYGVYSCKLIIYI